MHMHINKLIQRICALYINSVDQRERATNKHWADQAMGERVYYTENKGLAVLIIEDVRKSDGGQYRCREDYKYSPTRNNFILLDIISKHLRFKTCCVGLNNLR